LRGRERASKLKFSAANGSPLETFNTVALSRAGATRDRARTLTSEAAAVPRADNGAFVAS
jgi:hypothetical protein